MGTPACLVEVWAADGLGAGKSGSGWAVGGHGVLTAHHVIEPFLRAQDGSGKNRRSPESAVCQARLATTTISTDWLDFDVLWTHPTLDVALLKACDAGDPKWAENDFFVLTSSFPVRLARIGDRVTEAEAIGFPDSNARADGVRQPEQPPGVLMPAGGARDAQHLVPFDISTSVPSSSSMWQGMSGAAVRDSLGRLVGLVIAVHPDRQHRRLHVILLEDIIETEGFAAAAASLSWQLAIEDSAALSPTEIRQQRIALLRWLADMPDRLDNYSAGIWQLGFKLTESESAKKELRSEIRRLENEGRRITERFTRIEQLLPQLFLSMNPGNSQQREFAELFPALQREYKDWFWTTYSMESAPECGVHPVQGSEGRELIVPAIRIHGSDDVELISIPSHVFYEDEDVSEYTKIFRSATDLLIQLFPINEQQEAGVE